MKPQALLFLIDRDLRFLNAYEKAILKIVVRMPQGCKYPSKEIATQIGASRETVLRSVKNLEHGGFLDVEKTKGNNWILTVGNQWLFAAENDISLGDQPRSKYIPERKKSTSPAFRGVVPQTTGCSPTDYRGVVPQTTHKGIRKEFESVVITTGRKNHPAELTSALYAMLLRNPQSVGYFAGQSAHDTLPSGGDF